MNLDKENLWKANLFTTVLLIGFFLGFLIGSDSRHKLEDRIRDLESHMAQGSTQLSTQCDLRQLEVHKTLERRIRELESQIAESSRQCYLRRADMYKTFLAYDKVLGQLQEIELRRRN